MARKVARAPSERWSMATTGDHPSDALSPQDVSTALLALGHARVSEGVLLSPHLMAVSSPPDAGAEGAALGSLALCFEALRLIDECTRDRCADAPVGR